MVIKIDGRKLRCAVCGRRYNTKKDTYGFHSSTSGVLKKCSFAIFPARITTNAVPFNKFKPIALMREDE